MSQPRRPFFAKGRRFAFLSFSIFQQIELSDSFQAAGAEAPIGPAIRIPILNKDQQDAGSRPSVRSRTTSLARMSPAAGGTKAVLPGICRRTVQVRLVPSGQMQW